MSAINDSRGYPEFLMVAPSVLICDVHLLKKEQSNWIDKKHAWYENNIQHMPCQYIYKCFHAVSGSLTISLSIICLAKVNGCPSFLPFLRRLWSTSLRFAAPTSNSAVGTRSPTTAPSTRSRPSGARPSPACLR